jgi:hypothetical protein
MPSTINRPSRALRIRACALAAIGAVPLAFAVASLASAAPADTPHLPDLQTLIPLDKFSIEQTPNGPEFRYTHWVFNAGNGPLQIRPFYRDSAGNFLGRQEITTHNSADEWRVQSRVRVADAFVYHAAHGHFHFPLASFGLYRVRADGGFGAVVRKSPKNGFCISDSFLYDTTLAHSGVGLGTWGDCADPTTLRGLSVGGVDEYDYRDPGQAIPIAGVLDGTYWFRAITDPDDYLVESDESNNETDVKVTISNGTVTTGEVRHPDTTPCTAKLGSVSEGSRRRGDIRLVTTTSLSKPAKVEYLVDGKIAATVTGKPAPYAGVWRSTAFVDGQHWLASRVTAGTGRICTSPVVSMTLDNAHGPDTTGPLVDITDPGRRATVGGRVAVSANAADSSGIKKLQFTLDGKPLGKTRLKAPFQLVWNSRSTKPGKHVLRAVATDNVGNVGRDAVTIFVKHVAPPKRIRIDGKVVAKGNGALTSPALSTRHKGDVLLALVSYDGPGSAGAQWATVSGGGLRWKLQKRSNTQAGVSEIWSAHATGLLSNRKVTATPLAPGYDGMLSVFAFRNARRLGVAAAAGSSTGPPSFYLPAIQEGSWVFTAGNDWDAAVPRTPVSSQRIFSQWVDSAAGDTFWVQATKRPTLVHRLVTIRDLAPTTDRWNFVGVEVVAKR